MTGSTSAWRRRLRATADRAARASGILALRERDRARALTVLTYHRVLPEERCGAQTFPSLVMPLGPFREQVRWLAAHGEVLPLGEALARAGEPGSRPRCALTFDDGYHDSRDFVAEVLEEAGVRGTFFVATGFVETGEPLWFDRSARLFSGVDEPARRAIVRRVLGGAAADEPGPGADGAAWTRFLKSFPRERRAEVLDELECAAGGPAFLEEARPMSPAQVGELHRRGHEVGSHTVSHAMLPELDDGALRGEIEGARDALEGWTGVRPRGFAYPNGDHDERAAAALARAGHAYACTTRDGLHAADGDPFAIRRVDVSPQRVVDGSGRLDVTAFRRELCGLYRRRERVRAPWGAR